MSNYDSHFCGKIAKLQREAAHLRQSADTAEATMKVLSQHAKALAQAHMKLQSSKEEADSNIKKGALKVHKHNHQLNCCSETHFNPTIFVGGTSF